jgi:NAD(P)-dependent dehydrogenase (short-subunit alcohol dehydrogenase family)
MGARIVLIARDKTRADATLARLRDNAPGIAHAIYLADLLRLADMKRVAAQVSDHEPRIDVLINNAGGLFATRRLTEDGLEYTFALNHMAYSVVTEGLRERLLASRVQHVSSIPPPPRTKAPRWISTIFNRRRASEP